MPNSSGLSGSPCGTPRMVLKYLWFLVAECSPITLIRVRIFECMSRMICIIFRGPPFCARFLYMISLGTVPNALDRSRKKQYAGLCTIFNI